MKTILLLLITGLYVSAHAMADTEPASLSVRGEAQLMVKPDQVTISLGVVSEAQQVKVALQQNSRQMHQVIDALEKLGLTQAHYSTQNVSIQPRWSARARMTGNKMTANNDPPQIIGYQVRNNLVVKTTQLDSLGELINVTAAAGANQLDSIVFGLSNPRQYREQALAQATANARADADALAVASGSRINKILSINLDNAATSLSRVAQSDMIQSRALMSAEASISPPIQSGDITVRASVSIRYEIAETTP